ncbi:ribosome assembly RNA-binding protein YhbY [Proteiniclasticum sp. SCR006]|uniref:Ribosome assembly RNA-binding protein YhbY n=1 Tax=Proteiniclasticum aestuarii TaxID=2817862 RepID=A0A939H9R5_9CLOT|nr:ribosome assembly RNA-binding protein YhbY [Proteiniclasticum aestuarii]MBO1265776.1 ribosome assembly RNA-binding protein YhbY [Proteiniclasticum aestuarii]
MITTKQRAYLRSLANKIDSIFQIGKGGIEAPFIKQVEDALEKRELVKITVLENSGMDPRDAHDHLVGALGCEGVQVIGSKIVLYKESKNNKKIELPGK